MPQHLEFDTAGEGPPLLILHGLLGSKQNWKSLAARFSSLYHVFSLDLRNHGGSPHYDSMTYPEMAEDVREVMDANQITKTRILGHSMGGKVAMVFALTYPERVEKLIAADIAPVYYDNSIPRLVASLADLNLETVGSRGNADLILEKKIPEKRVRRFLLTNLVKVDGKLRWRVNLEKIRKSLTTLQGFPAHSTKLQFSNDALFVRGEKSDYVRDERRPQILKMFPKANFETVSGAGHWLHAENPNGFFDSVIKFLE